MTPDARTTEGRPAGSADLHEDHDRMLAAFVRRDADVLVAEAQTHFRHRVDALQAMRSDADPPEET